MHGKSASRVHLITSLIFYENFSPTSRQTKLVMPERHLSCHYSQIKRTYVVRTVTSKEILRDHIVTCYSTQQAINI